MRSRLIRHPLVQAVMLAALVLALAAAWRMVPLKAWVDQALRPIQAAGVWGYGLYVLAYVVAVVLVCPAWVLSFAAGYLYEPWLGVLLAWTGAVLGASAAFLMARTVLRARVLHWIERDRRWRAVDRAVAERGGRIVLLLRLSPVVPYNLLNYALGVTGIGFWPYAIATAVGMVPGTTVTVLVGSAFRGLNWRTVLIALVPTLLAIAYVSWVARRAIESAEAEAEAHARTEVQTSDQTPSRDGTHSSARPEGARLEDDPSG